MAEIYPLESLLNVRNYREDAAKRNLTRAQQTVKDAEQARLDRIAELERWRVWKVEETDRRYAAFLGKVTVIEKIDEFNRGLSHLAEQEVGKVAAVDEAEAAVDRAKKACVKAQEAAKEARKNTAKIETHKEIWTAESKKEAERKEDLELEEFKPVMQLGQGAEDDHM